MAVCLAHVAIVLALLSAPLGAQVGQPAGAAQDPQTAIGKLGDLDYATRMNAARQVRRAPAEQTVAALAAAVKGSTDQFVRYRALVLLTGFVDRRTGELMRGVTNDRNDRIREVAYRWMATRPQETSVPVLLSALQGEQAEFVRPALVRALAAAGGDPLVQSALVGEVSRGQDFFRLGVIDALGEFKAVYARNAIVAVAAVEGPLQDDAILALGRIGDRSAADVLASLQPSTAEVATAINASMCLLSGDCGQRIQAITEVALRPSARSESVGSVTTALAILGASGVEQALTTLADLGSAPRTQGIGTVGIGGVALRNPEVVLAWLARLPQSQQTAMVELLRSAFERFEEDFAEEQFFAATRAAYWKAAEGSADRALMALLIQRLDF